MTATQLTPRVWVGDAQDALTFEGVPVCVLEGMPAQLVGKAIHLPFLVGADVNGPIASEAGLDVIATLVNLLVRTTKSNVLIHCAAGIERGPLASAWYLWKTGQYESFPEAYDYVKKTRTQAQDRTSWVRTPFKLKIEVKEP